MPKYFTLDVEIGFQSQIYYVRLFSNKLQLIIIHWPFLHVVLQFSAAKKKQVRVWTFLSLPVFVHKEEELLEEIMYITSESLAKPIKSP